METSHLLMNLLLPPIIIITILLVSPIYFFYTIVQSFIRSFTMEDMTQKVVLITGASSGIGEVDTWLDTSMESTGKRLPDFAEGLVGLVGSWQVCRFRVWWAFITAFRFGVVIGLLWYLFWYDKYVLDGCLAYEYAKRGARLALVARRETMLKEVAKKARAMGSPDVIISCADVANSDHCKRFVEETISHFGRMDHLVNNAGVSSSFYFEEASNITNAVPVMNVNYWGSVYATHFSLPHLKKTKGKIAANASSSAWLYGPDMSMYSASKAAMMNFYETLRIELGSTVTITTISLGFVESEMIEGKHIGLDGKVVVDPARKDAVAHFFPIMKAKESARLIVDGVCRGDRDVTDPSWLRALYLCKVFVPEVLEWVMRLFFVAAVRRMESFEKKNGIAAKKVF